MSDDYKPVMTLKEVAAYLQAHRQNIYKLLKRGEIPARRIGRYWRFNRERIDEWRFRQDSGRSAEHAKKDKP